MCLTEQARLNPLGAIEKVPTGELLETDRAWSRIPLNGILESDVLVVTEFHSNSINFRNINSV